MGERFYLYACEALAVGNRQWVGKRRIWSDDLDVSMPPGWMIELAAQVKLIEPELMEGRLARGMIVGSAVIERVVPPDPRDGAAGRYRWELTDVERLRTPRKPHRHPQPIWLIRFRSTTCWWRRMRANS